MKTERLGLWMGVLFAGCVVAGSQPVAFAESETVDGVEWLFEVEDGGAVVTGANANWYWMGMFPSVLGGYPVTTIGENAFFSGPFNSLGSPNYLYLPDSLSSIRDYAFYYAFNDTNKLWSVWMPSSVTNIGESAFAACRGLAEITLSSGVEVLPHSAFYECSGLRKIEIPDGVTTIEPHAFDGCSGLEELTIPTSVQYVGYHAFKDCTGLKSLTIPQCLCTGEYCTVFSCGDPFYGHIIDTVENLVIQYGTTDIGDYAFLNCFPHGPDYAPDYLPVSVLIPGTVTNIGTAAFSACAGLTDLTIPDSVAGIGDRAFEGTSLQSVMIPDKVTRIGDSTFSMCSRLERVEIPQGVTSIGDETFYMCGRLASLAIPANVTNIGQRAFATCQGLTSLVIPDSVETIGSNVFADCSALETLSVPGSWQTKYVDGVFWSNAAGVPDACSVFYRTVPQGITFVPIGSQTATNRVVLQAYASSGGEVVFSVVSGPGVVTGNMLTFTGAGTVVVHATQPGCGEWMAVSAEQSIEVTKAAQTVVFRPIGAQTAGNTVTLSATATGGGSITYEVVSGPGTLNGKRLTLTAAGVVTVRAVQAGNAKWERAEAVREVVAAEADAAAPIEAAAYESWVRESGLDGGCAPQSVVGANGHENWENYLWDVPPTSTNTLDMDEVEVDEQGNVVFRVGAASARRWYSLQVWRELGGDPEVIDLGRGENGMGVTNEMQGGEWFGRLEVRTEE